METLFANGENTIQFDNYTDETNPGGDLRLLVVVKSCGFMGQQEVIFSQDDITVFGQCVSKLINGSGSSAVLKSNRCDEFIIEIKPNHANALVVTGQLSSSEPAETTAFNHSLRFSFALQFTDLTRVLGLPILAEHRGSP